VLERRAFVDLVYVDKVVKALASLYCKYNGMCKSSSEVKFKQRRLPVFTMFVQR